MYTCSMETVQQNGRFTLFSNKFPSNIYSILFGGSFMIMMYEENTMATDICVSINQIYLMAHLTECIAGMPLNGISPDCFHWEDDERHHAICQNKLEYQVVYIGLTPIYIFNDVFLSVEL